MVAAGELIPGDGEIVEGIASVDESAITGESAPVIRESGGDRSAVTGGTRVLSDWIVVRITAEPGETFIDRMISLVEGAERQKTPNEIALTLLLVEVHDHLPAGRRDASSPSPSTRAAVRRRADRAARLPDPDHDRRPALRDRHRRDGPAGPAQRPGHERAARSRRPATCRRLLLDKTGTITLGNRQAVALFPAPGLDEREFAETAQVASLADETPEGRSIVVLAKQRYGLRERDFLETRSQFVPFTAQTRMSGVDLDGIADPQGCGGRRT